LSEASNIPRSSLFDIFKRGGQIRRVSSRVKPLLTEENKKARIQFCLSLIKPNREFEDLYDHVHIDEKWFYLMEEKRSYYLMNDEGPPLRACKSKRFITKVMFLAAVARPRYDPHRKQYFDGKIGLWPFVLKEPAKRNSKNRPKGTMITKPVESVNTAVVKKMLVENVLPSIRSKFPRFYKHAPIYIQQDNAGPHSYHYDEELLMECSKEGRDIEIKSQPPNSPDFNVLDLGFFNSIQSLQHHSSPKTIGELIECVIGAFNSSDKEKLNNVFLTFQTCMESAMLVAGGNQYKMQRMGKEKLSREGRLPVTITCSENSILKANESLNT